MIPKPLQRVARALVNRSQHVDLTPHPLDPILEALPVLGSVRDVHKYCCRKANDNHATLPWAEFGVSKGTTASWFLEELGASNRMYFFDSWEGLPERWELVPAGKYAANVPDFKDGRALLIKGWFEDTVPGWAATQTEPLGLVHLDADLYSSTNTVLSHLNQLIVPGTVILFDEYYNYEGWDKHEHKAFLEFTQRFGREFAYLGKNDKYRAFPERIGSAEGRVESKYVRVAVEITQ